MSEKEPKSKQSDVINSESNTETHETKHYPRNNKGKSSLSLLSTLILCAVVSITTTAATLMWYHTKVAPKVIAFNLKKFTDELRIKKTDGKITEEQMLAEFDNMTLWLDALPSNHIVLLKELVLKNGEKAPY